MTPPERNAPQRYQLADLSATERDALLHARVSAMLAFVDGEGFPRLAPCWFLWADGAFYISSSPDKFHVRCLRANPRASVGVEVAHVSPAAVANRQVKGVGRVELLEDPECLWTRRIRAKYLGDMGFPEAVAVPEPAPVVIRLAPRRLTAHGGGQRLPTASR